MIEDSVRRTQMIDDSVGRTQMTDYVPRFALREGAFVLMSGVLLP